MNKTRPVCEGELQKCPSIHFRNLVGWWTLVISFQLAGGRTKEVRGGWEIPADKEQPALKCPRAPVLQLQNPLCSNYFLLQLSQELIGSAVKEQGLYGNRRPWCQSWTGVSGFVGMLLIKQESSSDSQTRRRSVFCHIRQLYIVIGHIF